MNMRTCQEVDAQRGNTRGVDSDHEEPRIHIQQQDQETNKRRTNRPEINRSLGTIFMIWLGPRIYIQA